MNEEGNLYLNREKHERKKSFTKNERRNIFLWINNLEKDILQEKGSCVTQQDFQRYLLHGLTISIS
jgi:hypothetical protein